MKTVSHKSIWRLAGPLILTNVSIALLGIVDTAVVGHLGEPYYLGAVAVATVIFDFLYWGMGFLRMGTTGIVSQAHGREDNAAVRVAIAHSVSLGLLIAGMILLLQKPLCIIGLQLTGASEQVRAHAGIYFYWAVWGAPAVLAGMSLTGWLLGMQNAKATLVIAVVVNIVNIILDFIFVFGLGLDVRGVALASVIAQYSGLVTAIYFVRNELRCHPGAWLRSMLVNTDYLRSLFALNQNIFIRTLCLIFVFAFFTRQGARQSDLILAANAVLLNFQMLTALGLDGFANAAEALVGKALGAEDRQSFLQVCKLSLQWSLLLAVLYTVFYFLAGDMLVRLMTDIQAVSVLASEFLPWLVVLPLVSVWCFLLDGIFIGATRGVEMRNTMLFSTLLVFLPAWYGLHGLKNHGLWLAMLLFFVARGLSMGLVYYRIEQQQSWIERVNLNRG